MNMSKYARNLSDRQLLASEGMCRANSSEDEADYNAESIVLVSVFGLLT